MSEPKESMSLPVPLTPQEVAIRAQELASAEERLADAEKRLVSVVAAAKSAKEQCLGEIADARMAVSDLALIVRGKREDRDVRVEESIDWDAACVHTVRTDTGEIVSTRGLNESERQRSMFQGDGRKRGGGES